MDLNHCRLYPFFKATRGNWHNALYIKCCHDTCPYGHTPDCGKFLMTVGAGGCPILIPLESLEKITGESIQPEECFGILNQKAFEAAYSLYIEWHTVSPADCALWQLSQMPDTQYC